MPDPIDPNKSMGEFLFGSDWETGQGITDPEFQRRLIDAEREFSPEYVQNELTRQNMALFGSDDQPGLLALYEQAAPITERMRAQTASAAVGSGGRDPKLPLSPSRQRRQRCR